MPQYSKGEKCLVVLYDPDNLDLSRMLGVQVLNLII